MPVLKEAANDIETPDAATPLHQDHDAEAQGAHGGTSVATTTIASSHSRRKTDHTRFPFLLTYRRQFWSLDTCSRFRRFATADEARAFVARVSRRKSKGGRLHARLEIRDEATGHWRDVPLTEQEPSP